MSIKSMQIKIKHTSSLIIAREVTLASLLNPEKKSQNTKLSKSSNKSSGDIRVFMNLVLSTEI